MSNASKYLLVDYQNVADFFTIMFLGDLWGQLMASITIRNLDDNVKKRLRIRAAENDRSVSEEVRVILRDAVGPEPSADSLLDVVRKCFGPGISTKLELPPRDQVREPPTFD